MVLKTDGTKIYNDVNGNSNVRIYSYRAANNVVEPSPFFIIPDTLGKLDCYRGVYVRWNNRYDSSENAIVFNSSYAFVTNNSSYPKLVNVVMRVTANTDHYVGDTYKVVGYPFIIAPRASVRLRNVLTDRPAYWGGEVSLSVVAMPVTVPCAVSTPASSRPTSAAVNVSTIVSGTDKLQLLDLITAGHSYLADIGASGKIPYIVGSRDANYQENWWYTNTYIRSSADIDSKRINDLTHTGYSLYQLVSSCSITGSDTNSDIGKTFKDGQIGLPFAAYDLQVSGISLLGNFTYLQFQQCAGEASSVWNTLQWGKKYLKVTSQYFGYSYRNVASVLAPYYPDPSIDTGFYDCPAVTYDSNGNIISDNVDDAKTPINDDPHYVGVTIFFPLTDMHDGHLGSAYVVTEIVP